MRSGNGRHRRPRQAPALVVAAGVTGSAIALPLLGAGTASAADAATWDRVAECETGGTWSADLGNGYYGGLQLSQEAWQAYGGTAYAPRADLATRAQQIAVAEKVFAARGSAAWETCAPIAGLADGGESAPVDSAPAGAGPAGSAPDTAPDPAESTGADAGAPREPAGRTGTATGAGGSPAPAPGATEEEARTAPEASAPPAAPPAGDASAPAGDAPAARDGADGPAAGTGRHRGEPAEEGAATVPDAAAGPAGPGDPVGGRGDDGHASRGDGAARTADGLAADGTYTVRPGDSLSAIADTHEVPGGWPALYGANREVVGADPDLILPGQSLDLGADEG